MSTAKEIVEGSKNAREAYELSDKHEEKIGAGFVNAGTRFYFKDESEITIGDETYEYEDNTENFENVDFSEIPKRLEERTNRGLANFEKFTKGMSDEEKKRLAMRKHAVDFMIVAKELKKEQGL
jgi:hypothetical protein